MSENIILPTFEKEKTRVRSLSIFISNWLLYWEILFSTQSTYSLYLVLEVHLWVGPYEKRRPSRTPELLWILRTGKTAWCKLWAGEIQSQRWPRCILFRFPCLLPVRCSRCFAASLDYLLCWKKKNLFIFDNLSWIVSISKILRKLSFFPKANFRIFEIQSCWNYDLMIKTISSSLIIRSPLRQVILYIKRLYLLGAVDTLSSITRAHPVWSSQIKSWNLILPPVITRILIKRKFYKTWKTIS